MNLFKRNPPPADYADVDRLRQRLEQLESRANRILWKSTNATSLSLHFYGGYGHISISFRLPGSVSRPKIDLVKSPRDRKGIKRFVTFTGKELIDWIDRPKPVSYTHLTLPTTPYV